MSDIVEHMATQLEKLSDEMLRLDMDLKLSTGSIDPRDAAAFIRAQNATITSLRAEVERLKHANRETAEGQDFFCTQCGKAHNIDTSIPSEIWNQIATDDDFLCALCIDDRMAASGLTCDAKFYFVGKALSSELYSRHDKARADKAEAALAKATAAICWALGEEGDFQPRGEGQPTYWWRKELRRLASLTEGEKE